MNEMEKLVYILMSTYNGEKFLESQLKSILSQKGVRLKIFIRDDGSSDKTCDIIEKFINKGYEIKLERGKNIGVKRSFMHLIKAVDQEADYYALSDQDDFWLREKLYKAIQNIESYNYIDIPILYFSHTKLVNENLKSINTKNPFNKKTSYNFGQILIKNCASGCTMVMNKQLKNTISMNKDTDMEYTPMHDHWIYMICMATGGKAILDKNSYILYRQHTNNAIGAKRNIMTKIINCPIFKKECVRSKWAKKLMMDYGIYIIDREKSILNDIINYKKNWMCTLKLAFNPYIKPEEILEKIIIFLTIITRRF